jgi:hypothetical protein
LTSYTYLGMRLGVIKWQNILLVKNLFFSPPHPASIHK